MSMRFFPKMNVRLLVNEPNLAKNPPLFQRGRGCCSERKRRQLSMEQQADWGQSVQIAAKVDLSGMDTTNLYFYSCDSKQ